MDSWPLDPFWILSISIFVHWVTAPHTASQDVDSKYHEDFRRKLGLGLGLGLGAAALLFYNSRFMLKSGEEAFLINRFLRCAEKSSDDNVGKGHQTIAGHYYTAGMWHYHLPVWCYLVKFDMLTRPREKKVTVKTSDGMEAEVKIRALARLNPDELLHTYKANRFYSLYKTKEERRTGRQPKDWNYTTRFWQCWAKATIKVATIKIAAQYTAADLFNPGTSGAFRGSLSREIRRLTQRKWRGVIIEDVAVTSLRFSHDDAEKIKAGLEKESV